MFRMFYLNYKRCSNAWSFCYKDCIIKQDARYALDIFRNIRIAKKYESSVQPVKLRKTPGASSDWNSRFTD